MARHISWVDEKEKRLEMKILAEYSSDDVRKHLEYLASLTRIAGSEDERKAANYIKGELEAFGLEAKIHEFDGYVSYPGEATLEILSPVEQSFRCLSLAFMASTPAEGIEAELIYAGGGDEKDFRGLNVKGKIVVIGPVRKEAHGDIARTAEKCGAAGQIYVNRGSPRAIDIAQLRQVWGSPTPETMNDLPSSPAVSVCNEDGKYLIDRVRKGRVVAKLKAHAWRGYTKLRFPTGTVRGRREPEKFVLFASHYCSWYKGATDNAASNALLLEMARIFAKHRKSLGRSITFAWWTGHSQGNYAGSTWFVDNFWDDIRDHGIAYFVMDGLGRRGSSGFDPRNSEVMREFHEGVIRETLGLEVRSRRLSRSGDQSTWGIGVPSASGETTFSEEQKAAMDGKPVWYSHTVDDTLDKVDMEVLNIPFQVNAVSILRLCNNPILPFECVSVSESLIKRLQDLRREDKSGLGLASLLKRGVDLRSKAEALNREAERILSVYGKKGSHKALERRCEKINQCLMNLSRLLIPALYSKVGKYGQDPGQSKYKPIPGLQALERLRSMDDGSEEYKALRTSLVRERNRMADVLEEAIEVLDRALDRESQRRFPTKGRRGRPTRHRSLR